MDPSMPICGPRPEWSIIGKCNENMETILFREKFTKWPDGGKLIKMKGKDKETDAANTEALNLTAADVLPMLTDDMTDANLILEGGVLNSIHYWSPFKRDWKINVSFRPPLVHGVMVITLTLHYGS